MRECEDLTGNGFLSMLYCGMWCVCPASDMAPGAAAHLRRSCSSAVARASSNSTAAAGCCGQLEGAAAGGAHFAAGWLLLRDGSASRAKRPGAADSCCPRPVGDAPVCWCEGLRCFWGWLGAAIGPGWHVAGAAAAAARPSAAGCLRFFLPMVFVSVWLEKESAAGWMQKEFRQEQQWQQEWQFRVLRAA